MTNLRTVLMCGLAGAGLAGCAAEPFSWDQATPEQRHDFLQGSADGMRDGLASTLPRGTNGIYAEMGLVRIDEEAKSIDIVVNVTDGGDRMPNNSALHDQMLAQVCEQAYVGSDLGRNAIAVTVRYMLPGGGSRLSLTMNPDSCAAVMPNT